MAPPKYWLLKAEPDSRIVKDKDVKFSVDDFESIRNSPWEGVRNYEARNLMKEMKIGEKALFYHSNCKNPGIAAFAEVSKEAYPDYTAWDESHPYYDPKTRKDDPKWFMVDLTFVSRTTHFVPLALLRFLSENNTLPEEIGYIKEAGLRALQAMDLVKKGRLSVQRVSEEAWTTIVTLAENGGWEEMDLKIKKGQSSKSALKSKTKGQRAGKKVDERDPGSGLEEEEKKLEDDADIPAVKKGNKRKAKNLLETPRRSTRTRR